MSEPVVVLQEHHAPMAWKGTPPRRSRRPGKARARTYSEMFKVVAPESSISPVSRGRQPLRSVTTSRTTRRPQRATPSSVG
jgi:hypothetical protein